MAARSASGNCWCQGRLLHKPGGNGAAAFARSGGCLVRPHRAERRHRMARTVQPDGPDRMPWDGCCPLPWREGGFCRRIGAGGCSRNLCVAAGICPVHSSCRIARLAHWPAEGIPPCLQFTYVFPRDMMPAGYLASMLAMPRPSRKTSAQKCSHPRLDSDSAPP